MRISLIEDRLNDGKWFLKKIRFNERLQLSQNSMEAGR